MANASEGKIWNKSFTVLTCTNFLSTLAFYLLMVAVTGYSVEAYNIDLGTAALAVTLYVAGSMLGRILFGKRIDAWGFKRAVLIGYGTNLVLCALYLIHMDWVPFLVLRFVHGLGFALQSGAGSAGAASMLPVERRGEGIGYFAMFQACGTALGPFAAALFSDVAGGYYMLFVAMTFIYVFVFGLAFLIDDPDKGKKRELMAKDKVSSSAAQGGLKGFASQFVSLTAIPPSFVMLLLYVAYGAVLSYMLDFSATIDANIAAKAFFLVYAGVMIVSRFFCGRIVDRKGPAAVLFPTLIVSIVSLFVMAVAYGDIMLLLAAALMGFGVGTSNSTSQSLISKIVPREELGRANSTYLLALDIGSGAGPVIFGAIMVAFGYGVAWAVMGVLAIAAFGFYLLIRKRGLAG